MEKEKCPVCKDLPEGEVVKGHDHRYMCRNYGQRIARLESALIRLAERYEDGAFDGAHREIVDLLSEAKYE